MDGGSGCLCRQGGTVAVQQRVGLVVLSLTDIDTTGWFNVVHTLCILCSLHTCPAFLYVDLLFDLAIVSCLWLFQTSTRCVLRMERVLKRQNLPLA